MWFLIKGSVWFAAVLVVLSYFSSKPAIEIEGANGSVQMGDAISAATEAYNYVTAICAEKPDVCVKGGETLSALGVRATEGARVAFELLDKQFGAKSADIALKTDPEPSAFPQDVTASTTQSIAAASPAQTSSFHTGSIPLPMKRPVQ